MFARVSYQMQLGPVSPKAADRQSSVNYKFNPHCTIVKVYLLKPIQVEVTVAVVEALLYL